MPPREKFATRSKTSPASSTALPRSSASIGLRCTSLTTARRQASGSPSATLSGSLPSFRRTATPTRKVLAEGWSPIRAYWQDPSQANRKALRAFLTPETTRWQYTHGVPDPTMVSPDGQNLHNFYLARPGADEVQLDLFGDYKNNVALYPSFQEYFRTTSRRFSRCGARTTRSLCRLAPRRSSATILGAVVRFLDTGHFALETHAHEIAESIRDFLK